MGGGDTALESGEQVESRPTAGPVDASEGAVEEMGVGSEWLVENMGTLWVVAILFFGVGDILTTRLGYAVPVVVEAGPVAAPLVTQYGIGMLVVLKAATLGVGYLCCRYVPRPHAVGSPLALAVVGVAVTGWNTIVLLSVLLPTVV